MKPRLSSYICSAAAVSALFLGTADAATWSFTSVKSSFNSLPPAVGNGTADDTAAINRAIANGTSIYFPPGTYRYVGVLTVPANTAYRFYGDGPGISKILFNTASTGINAPNRGSQPLQIEGLTIVAGTANCGTAISAAFDPAIGKYRSATIRNVEIAPSDRSLSPTGYWVNGISLYQAPNALIEDVQVHGKFDFSQGGTSAPIAEVGISWFSSADHPTTQLFLHNTYVEYFKVGVQTSGWVEGFYMSGFELVFCGSSTRGAMELTGATYPNGGKVPTFYLSNGHVNQITEGIRMTNLVGVKISHVNFLNQLGNGTHLSVTNCTDASITDSDFFDYGSLGENQSNGIYLFSTTAGATTGTKISGNTFSNMTQSQGGSCVVVQANCRRVQILDNDFGNSPSHINNMAGNNAFIRETPPFP